MTPDETELAGQPLDEVPKQNPSQDCNARKSSNGIFEGYCDARAGAGTDHLGEGRCTWHGGNTPRGEDSPHFVDGSWSKFADPDADVVEAVGEIADDIAYLEEMRDERMAKYYQGLKHLAENEGTAVAMEILDQIEAGQEVDYRLIRQLASVISASSVGMDRLVARIQRLTNDIIEAKDEHPERLEVEHSMDNQQLEGLREDIASAYGGDE
jgi:hypothetical protein